MAVFVLLIICLKKKFRLKIFLYQIFRNIQNINVCLCNDKQMMYLSDFAVAWAEELKGMPSPTESIHNV